MLPLQLCLTWLLVLVLLTQSGDTALETELEELSTSTSVSSNVVTYTATFAAGTGTGAVTEAGILNASSSGTLLVVQNFL